MSYEGCLTVHRYEPAYAVVGIPELLTVNLTYTDVITSDAALVQLRLNVGGQYVPTSVRPGPNLSLEMNAVIPSNALARAGQTLLLSVHAYRTGDVFDVCDFGTFKVLDEGEGSFLALE